MEKQNKKRNLCGQIVYDLGQQIISGQIQPGDSLPQETSLTEQMGVSRTVVREAVKSLAAKGLVESRSKRGTVVLPTTSWNYLDADVLLWSSQGESLGSHLMYLSELREAIEPAAAALAARRASEEKLEQITQAYREMEDKAENMSDFLAADLKFHTCILHATGNPLFSPIANAISATLQISLRVTNNQVSDNHASIPFHREILEALRNRDDLAAQKAMALHLKDAGNRIRDKLSGEN